MTVRESGEMYLEAILVLAKKSGYVRSIDVSEYLGYSKPSVSRAMGILREGGYILMEKDGAITLTDSGKKLAETIYERHTVLSELLIRLGVDEKGRHRRCVPDRARHQRRVVPSHQAVLLPAQKVKNSGGA